MTTTTAMTIRSRASAARRGFAFTEVLFAVMVLGLGFIMIAAMFPVTIRQTQSTLEEATAASTARGAMEFLQSIASEDRFPITVPPSNPANVGPLFPDVDANIVAPAQVVSLKDVFYTNPRNIPAVQVPRAWGGMPAYSAARGNFIDPRNPRIAWVPLYRRELNSPFAQVFVIAVQCRNRDQYIGGVDLVPPPDATAPAYATLDPRRIVVGVQWNNALQRGEITIPPDFQAFAGPGAYVIIANDPNLTPSTVDATRKLPGKSNGRIYQLGNPIGDPANGQYEIAPGTDMVRNNPTPANRNTLVAGDDNDLPLVYPYNANTSATAYIIGRGYTNPVAAAEGYSGPAQEIGVYTGYIYVPYTTPGN